MGIRDSLGNIISIGDIVECIDMYDTLYLMLGNKYVVNGISSKYNTLDVVNEVGKNEWFNTKRFIVDKVSSRNRVIDGILE